MRAFTCALLLFAAVPAIAADPNGAAATKTAPRAHGMAPEAQKQIALGWSRIKLDPKAALKNFEAAITADPRSAAVRVQRSKARLETGDASGAFGDSRDAIALEPGLGEAYAARAEAKRALGFKAAECQADLEMAAKLDGRFAGAKDAPALSMKTAPSGSGMAPEARKQIALGWSRIKLDPKAALKNFEAAITADPRSAAVRVQRSKARLEAGDAPGAFGDSRDAIALEPGLGEAYAARAEAKRALGRKAAECQADLEMAAKLGRH